jgi:hypothetical protein
MVAVRVDEKLWTKKEFKWLGRHGITVTKEFLSRDYNDPVVEPGREAHPFTPPRRESLGFPDGLIR